MPKTTDDREPGIEAIPYDAGLLLAIGVPRIYLEQPQQPDAYEGGIFAVSGDRRVGPARCPAGGLTHV